MKNQSSRIWTFEIIRPILLILVINVHTLLVFYRNNNHSFFYLHYLAVPLFVMMSVYLFQRKINSSDNIINLIKRIKRLIVPYHFWSFISILLIPGNLTLNNILWSFFLIPLTNGPLYFLTIMIFFNSIQFVNQLTKMKFSLPLLLILLSYFIEIFHINNSFSHIKEFIFRLTVMFGFSFLKFVGITLILFNFEHIIEKHSRKLIGVVILILTIMFLFIKTSIKFDGFDYNGGVIFVWATGIFTLLLAGKNMSVSEKIQRRLNIINKYALGIFCIHQIIITVSSSFLKRFLVLDVHIFEIIRLGYVLWIYSISFFCCYFLDNLSGHRLKLIVN